MLFQYVDLLTLKKGVRNTAKTDYFNANSLDDMALIHSRHMVSKDVFNIMKEAGKLNTLKLYLARCKEFFFWCLCMDEGPNAAQVSLVLNYLSDLYKADLANASLKVCVFSVSVSLPLAPPLYS